jgi:hypothetical protein
MIAKNQINKAKPVDHRKSTLRSVSLTIAKIKGVDLAIYAPAT